MPELARTLTVSATFSVIIPTYRRPDRLAGCVQSLAALRYPRDRFEVIVVDDGSENPPITELTRIRDRIKVTLVTGPHAGPAVARNAGVALARGHYLAFTDDDCTPDPNWLTALAARFAVVPDGVIGGRTVNALPDNPYSSATQLLVDYVCAWHRERGDAAFFPSNNLAIPTDRFRELGGFHRGFAFAAGEDREFCYRWVRAGGRMLYAPEALVHHAHPLNLSSFWLQHFTYGCGAHHFYRLRQHDPRWRAIPISFYVGLITCPLFRARPRNRYLLVSLLTLAQAATAFGYCRQRFRRERREPRRADRHCTSQTSAAPQAQLPPQ